MEQSIVRGIPKVLARISFLFLGLIGILLFHQGVYFSVAVSTFIFILTAWYLTAMYRASHIGQLVVLFLIVYALPFIHIIPYLWFDFNADPPAVMWGLVANPYQMDKGIIELMAMIGAVGAAGFVAGTASHRGRVILESSASRVIDSRHHHTDTLSLPVFLIWVAISLILSWINAPSETIFTAAYTESVSISSNWNFSSAWMISYAILLFTFADSLFDNRSEIASIKRRTVLSSFFVIVVWFQLLRGDRESLPCVIGALFMYYLWVKSRGEATSRRTKTAWLVILLTVSVVFVASYLIGAVRVLLVGIENLSDVAGVFDTLREADAIRFDSLLAGTWSAVLLSPLSVAGDYISDTLPLHYGQTYIDLVNSIIPGFVADWLGYTRPIDSLHGPAWQMIYAGGGLHAVVVPFTELRLIGVFVMMAIWGVALSRIEEYAFSHLSVRYVALLGIIIMAMPHWLWYGDKNIINALIIWFLVSLCYRMRLTSVAAGISRCERGAAV